MPNKTLKSFDKSGLTETQSQSAFGYFARYFFPLSLRLEAKGDHGLRQPILLLVLMSNIKSSITIGVLQWAHLT
ncbi:hypothetical protein [Alteromonas sp.]|jgi:hypothetical protein|uniref:hypothetical protein n=1 Tax=Alteromonas sp. TaxID=232 RepID=UPI0032D99E00